VIRNDFRDDPEPLGSVYVESLPRHTLIITASARCPRGRGPSHASDYSSNAESLVPAFPDKKGEWLPAVSVAKAGRRSS
jgi:hypothetical protein